MRQAWLSKPEPNTSHSRGSFRALSNARERVPQGRGAIGQPHIRLMLCKASQRLGRRGASPSTAPSRGQPSSARAAREQWTRCSARAMSKFTVATNHLRLVMVASKIATCVYIEFQEIHKLHYGYRYCTYRIRKHFLSMKKIAKITKTRVLKLVRSKPNLLS